MKIDFQKITLALFVLILAACTTAVQEPSKKNVLFIVVDDLKPLLNCYGATQIHSPNIDRLAADGVLFTNAHAQQAVCAPSRISFFTGMRPDYTKIWDLKTKMRDVVPNSLTLPEHFKLNGYRTVGLGKIMHGARNNDSQSWTQDFITEKDMTYPDGFDVPANLTYQSNAIVTGTKAFESTYVPAKDGLNEWVRKNGMLKAAGLRPVTESADVPDGAYSDGAATLESIELMKGFKQKGEDFFLTIGFRKPHLPFVAPKKYWDMYDRNDIQLAAYQDKALDSPESAYHNFGELKNYSDVSDNIDDNGRVIDEKQRELIHGYYACVSYIDAQVGLLLDYLKTSGLDKNTVVALVGDHGWHLGDHGLWNKHSNFEQATRTPLMISAPGLKVDIKNDSPVELVDLFPTICGLAGIESPDHLQGVTLEPILSGETASVKDFAMSQYPRRCHVMHAVKEGNPEACNLMGYAIRTDKYRYVMWYKGDYYDRVGFDDSAIEAEELYDYNNDPLETQSFANDPEYQEAKELLKEQLKSKVWLNG